MSVTFTVDTNDLRHILTQIRIAEEYASPTNTRTLQEIIGPDAALLPFGLRAVDGSNNNLLPGQSLLGAADQPFPRLLDAQYTTGTGSFDTNGPAPGGVVTNNDYSGPGTVIDTSIRTASNLISDMSPHNPAAIAAWFANPIAQAAYAEAHGGEAPPANYVPTVADLAFIPNQSPDIGLSPPFNGWMTLFGQFFDHGLDLVTKGGNGSVIVPLMPDDPLIAGADGVFGNTDDLPARALHDHAGQQVVTLNLGLNKLARHLTTQEALAEHQALLRQAQGIFDSLRYVILKLRPPALDEFGFATALRAMVQDWSELTEVKIEFEVTGRECPLPDEVSITLYRIAQEALTNVSKHGGTIETVAVILRFDADFVTLTVNDDGNGFDACPAELRRMASRGRLGLAGMRERLALVGGTLKIDSSRGHGTTVVARVDVSAGIPRE